MDRQQSVYVAATRICLFVYVRTYLYLCLCIRVQSQRRKYTCTRGCSARIARSRALKLSLYFIGRAYKSKASASQILEALHTPIQAGDVQNADTCLSVRVYLIGRLVLISTNMHHTCRGYLSMFIAVRIKACIVCFTDNN